jgi:UrcA family protein
MKLLYVGTIFVALSLTAMAAASAASASKTARADVFVGDLDLQSAGGMQVARDRIRRAAVRLCNLDHNSLHVDDAEVTAECIRVAESAAFERVREAGVRRMAAVSPQ